MASRYETRHRTKFSSEAAGAIASDLQRVIQGEVRFDTASRALYAVDSSNYRQVPIGVVIPHSVEDVIATVEIARLHGAPVLARGGGTSLAGQCCNVAIVIDFSKSMHHILELDPEQKFSRIEPGLVLDDLRNAAEKFALTFGPDPATHSRCTLGGMIGNNSCGVHSVMAGKTDDNIDELEILTYDGLRMTVGPTTAGQLEQLARAGGRKGEIFTRLTSLREKYAPLIKEKFPDIPRRVSGYNFVDLLGDEFNVAKALVGSESTCVMVLQAKTKLVSSPQGRALIVLGYPDIFTAADHVPELLEFKPIALEGIDDRLVSDMRLKGLHVENLKLLPKGNGWLLMEIGENNIEVAKKRAESVMGALRKRDGAPTMALYTEAHDKYRVWRIRESGLGATAIVPGRAPTWEGWEDSAVAPDKLGGYLRELRKLLESYDYRGDLYGHFGHGCVHTRIDFDLQSTPGVAKYRQFVHDAAHLCVKYGGSLSGEHGDGQSRAELLPIMFGDELIGAFREFKSIWDPQSMMNPGKVVDAYRVDENLRLGASYAPWDPETHFAFGTDDGSLAKASLRCVGVGECRKEHSGTMCPSYMVTREEMHSTRGRARLLWEMLQGEVITDGWKSEEVKEALDLCLACKGCKGECPVHVDMASYKAEFLSHYYAGRLRPRTAYTMGLIRWWAQIASIAPQVANFFMGTPVVSDVIKEIGGIAPDRKMPLFAPKTFRDTFAPRAGRRTERKRVMLWPDTFNNHFHPETASAAVEVLEWAGFDVVIPQKNLCCGRPLYDFGFMKKAKSMLREILDSLRDEIRAGTPVVGLEPSCVSIFRDELLNFFPQDEDAKRLAKQTFLLSEFLMKEKIDLPKTKQKAVLHGHCHQKSILDMQSEEELLQQIGIDFHALDSGCCGMAGAFGFEKQHYDVSVAAGERVLLPSVRDAARETLIISDGFSCREQVAQLTDRRAMHVAEVLKMAIREGEESVPREYPERRYVVEVKPPSATTVALVAGGIAGAAIIGFALRKKRKKRRLKRR